IFYSRPMLAKCLQAREMAYCSYSGFPVGAAVLTTGGQHDSTAFYLPYMLKNPFISPTVISKIVLWDPAVLVDRY
uniref:Zgc:103586 n=1 Tax=Sinocyclocheilus rhinocerous TaxID=307959 RepID=A0A673M7Z6_9TELE